MIPHEGLVVLRVPNWIGDCAMASAAVSAIRENRPGVSLVAICNSWVKELYIPGKNIDERWVYDPRRHSPSRLIDFNRIVRRLRRVKPVAMIMFQEAFEAGLMAWSAGIPVRVGMATDHRRLFLTHPVPLSSSSRLGHRVEEYLKVASTALGQPLKNYTPEVVIPDEEKEKARRWLHAHFEKDERFLAIAPGAAYGPAKRWLPERFAALIRRLKETLSIRSVCLGGVGDVPVIEEIRGHYGSSLLSVAGALSLPAQVFLIARAGVCLANDSGLMHLAAASGAVTVAVFGPTTPSRTRPYGDRHIVFHKPPECAPCSYSTCPTDHRCMTAVTVDEVFRAVTASFDRRFPSSGKSVMIEADGGDGAEIDVED